MEREHYRTAETPVRRGMRLAFLAGLTGAAVFGGLFLRLEQGWALAAAVTCGAVAYHMFLHFLSPVLLAVLFHRQYQADSWWFRPKGWEVPLYRFLGVKGWKKIAPTYDPREFSLKEHSIDEVINNMCHSEAVHELSAMLSFTSLFLAIPFGEFPIFLAAAVLAAGIDGFLAAIQRYNRPRLMRLRDRSRKGGTKP